MPQLRVTGGLLTVESASGPGAPDAGLPAPGSPGNELPAGGHPWIPGHLPDPPPNIWPPLTPQNPIQPTPPGLVPPGTIWPSPGSPSNELPSGGRPGHELPSQTFWVVCGIPGVGWRYVAVDPSLSVTPPMVPGATPR
jgi:hypothetical protein